MAMTAKLWSISALATEFDLDRRTVAKRINGIAPAGDLSGKPAWRLADVAGPLTGRGDAPPAKPAPPTPPGFERLAGLPALDQIATFALLEMTYRAPAQAAVLAVGAGADFATAYGLRKALILALSQLAADTARTCDLQPLAGNPDASLFDMAAFDDCDWHALAEMSGETVDLLAWDRHATQRFAA